MSINFIYSLILKKTKMGNICTSKPALTNNAAAIKIPTGSQYNLDSGTTNPDELKFFTLGKQY